MEALESVEVTSAAGQASGFQLSFQLNAQSPLNTIFLIAAGASAGGTVPPLLRVILIVTVNGMPHVLMDGVMTEYQAQAGQNGAPGTLSISGSDLTKVMDAVDFSGLPYPALPVEARVALIIAKYAAFGMIPLIVPLLFTDVPIPTEQIPMHQGTDLEYLEQLAREAGYVFYIEPGPAPGTNTAYFGPEIKVGVPQPALNLDMDAHTNVESLSFSFDSTKGVLPIVFIQNSLTKFAIPIPIPKLNPLATAVGTFARADRQCHCVARHGQTSADGGALPWPSGGARSQDAVTAKGSLDVMRYGRILRARQLVGVRGAGLAYNGLYYVQSVTTRLKRGEFKQNFNLTRNGLVSITPVVRP